MQGKGRITGSFTVSGDGDRGRFKNRTMADGNGPNRVAAGSAGAYRDELPWENMQSLLEFLAELEKEKCRLWERELEGMPAGRLHVRKKGNGACFDSEEDGKRRGITKQIDLVYQLARKRYLQIRISEKRKEMEALGLQIRSGQRKRQKQKQGGMGRIEKLLAGYGDAGLEILRITCSKEQYQWVKEQYRKSTKNPEQKIYETYSGVKVRSKSEQTIGNRLELAGIPYRYEMIVDLYAGWMEGAGGGNAAGYKSYAPDFVILTATGKLIIWEHLGRVDQEEYRAVNMEKIAGYRQGPEGFCEEGRLILTFERDLRRVEILDGIIARRVSPYI